MKKFLGALVAAMFVLVGIASGVAGVDDTIKLCQAGMSKDVVIAAAQRQPAVDLTADQMIAVKAACKSDEVVLVLMQQPVRAPQVVSGGGSGHSAVQPTSSVASNVFMINNVQRAQLKPETFKPSGFKKGLGGLASLAKASPKMLAELHGERAEVRTVSRRPEFTLPSDGFVLVILDRKDGKREAVVGSGGLMGARGGFDKKKNVDFRFENGGRGTLGQPLEAGEYAFYPADAFEASGETDMRLKIGRAHV